MTGTIIDVNNIDDARVNMIDWEHGDLELRLFQSFFYTQDRLCFYCKSILNFDLDLREKLVRVSFIFMFALVNDPSWSVRVRTIQDT